jgi:predicted sugar kinase
MCGDYMDSITPVKFWCYKILPLVYDDSLSYYEVLCKVVKKLNEVIENYSASGETIQSMQEAIAELQKWVDNFDTTFIEEVVQEYLEKMVKTVTFGISSAGYFMAVIPDWMSKIEFGTIQEGDLFGHLTLSYD